MKHLVFLCSLVAAAACHADGRGSETTRSAEAAQQAEAARQADAEAARKADAAKAEATRQAERLERLERKLDDINQKLDTVIARGATAPPARPARIEPDRAKVYAVSLDGDPVDGRADAKVTLVKAYDYACPYCEKVRGTLDDLKKRYGKDLRIVYKQLIVHPRNATAAALAFCAAARQGKALEMDRLLWEKGFNARQLDLTDVPLDAQGQGQADAQMVKCWDHPDGCKIVSGFAAELRLNMNKFKADLKGDCQAHVAGDGKQLAQLSVNATPSFFINGRFLSGAQPLEQFTAVIDEELKKANERIAAGTPAASYYKKWVLEQGLKSLTP